MQYLRLILLITFAWGWMQTVNAAALFGGPKTIPDDGTYNASSDTFSGSTGGNCEVRCNSSKGYIQVDIETRCMCISGSSCFKVDIGKPGTYTTNGLGTMGRAGSSESTYQTKPGRGDATRFDYDAISMGIVANSGVGKWIHKARDCQGGGQETIGCIGVPCAKWPEVKALGLEGKSVQVCNGVNVPTSLSCSRGAVKPCWNASVGITPTAVDRQIRAAMSATRPVDGSGSGSGSDRGGSR